jgi:hypothetical protein
MELYVNTWHVAPLHGGAPEGLPTDLLTTHSALFYLVDHVVVDRSGLEGEKKWLSHGWLSAKVFHWLETAGILRVVNLNDPPFLSELFWKKLALHPRGLEVQRIMQRQAHDIVFGDEETKQAALKRINTSILSLNQDIFLNLNVPDTWLPYYQTEAHLKANRWRTKDQIDLPEPVADDVKQRRNKRATLLQLVENYLPDPYLLPPVPSKLKRYLNDNMDREKETLFRVIYGDYPHENFQDFRTDKDFTTNDNLVDNEIREGIARYNFYNLVRIRYMTRDIRYALQDLIIRISDSELSLDAAIDQLHGELTKFREALNEETPLEKQIFPTIYENLTISLLEWLIMQSAIPYLKLPNGVTLPLLAVLLVIAKDKTLSPELKRRRIEKARLDYPLGALHEDLAKYLPQTRRLLNYR